MEVDTGPRGTPLQSVEKYNETSPLPPPSARHRARILRDGF